MTRTPQPPYLPELHARAELAFAPLVERFALQLLPPSSAHSRENGIFLRNGKLGLSIAFQAFHPVVEVALSQYAPDMRVLRTVPLVYLVRLRAPEMEEDLGWPAEDLPGTLDRLRRVLETCASDVLSGDFAVFGEVVPRILADRRADSQRRFGTSTGESPRFDRRPTLEDLFSDVTLPIGTSWLRVPRTYQAVWDYQYGLPEIARFLGISESQTAALVDEWDRLVMGGNR